MAEENKLKGEAVEERPSAKKHVAWAVFWFCLAMFVRVASVPFSDFLGMDEGNRYLFTRPLGLASDVAMLGASLIVLVSWVFPNTLGKDSGTRFNKAWAELDDPFRIVLAYAAFMAPVLVALAILMATN